MKLLFLTQKENVKFSANVKLKKKQATVSLRLTSKKLRKLMRSTKGD
jgi:hypothetical protein